MKKAISLLLALSMVFALCACGHQHTWLEATCTKPKTCSECGETEGEALGHEWAEATYETPKTCTRCGLTEGKPLDPPIDLEAIKQKIDIDFEICSGKGQSNASLNPRNDTAVITITNNSEYNLETVEFTLKLYKNGKLMETIEIEKENVLTSISSISIYQKVNVPLDFDDFTYEVTSVKLPEKDSIFYGNTKFSDLFDCKYQMNGNKAKILITNKLNKPLYMGFYLLEFDANGNILCAFVGSTPAKMLSDTFEAGKTYGDRQILLDIGCKSIAIAPTYIHD